MSQPRNPKASSSKSAAAKRRVLFAEAYLANGGNATDAAKKAGFSERTAYSQGHDLLKHPEVKALIAERQEELTRKYKLTTENVHRSISQALHFDPAKLYNDDGSLKKVTEMDEDTRMALAAIEVVEMAGAAKIGGDDGVGLSHVQMFTKKVRWLDKNVVREQAMRHLGMFEKDNKQIGEAIRTIIVPAKAKRDGAAKA